MPKIFFGGSYGGRASKAYVMRHELRMQKLGVRHRLISFAYREKLPLIAAMWNLRRKERAQ